MGYPHYSGDCHQYHSRVIDWGSKPPPLGVITLCGSTRFYEEFQRKNYELTMKGFIVLSVGFYMHSAEQAHGEQVGITESDKEMLDQLHKRKIDMSDGIFVLNVGGYIGDSTRGEIEYAKATGKQVTYMERVSE